MPVRVGVSFDGFVATGEAIALARRAVEAGASSLWMAEHLGYREAIATCMAFAIKTPGPMLVPTAVSPYLWHPMPTAMAMATLDEMAPGRVAIAVGAGNPLFLAESGRAIEKPVRAMREFTEALRKLWSGEAVHVDGEFTRLAGAQLAFRPSAPIPIYIAAIGPDMLRLAGPHRRRRGPLRGIVDGFGAPIDRGLHRRRQQGRPPSEQVPPRRISVFQRLP
jgi:alkanesulfonate monooxygenase SsuD/methylene tetrahydromethanopterin reductase-like flavin-dependent oxidoreductase (luciferase family)